MNETSLRPADFSDPTRRRAKETRRVRGSVASVLLVAVMATGCSIPITEPEGFPAAIVNQLDEPVEILEFRVATPEATILVARIEAGDVHEFPMGALCGGAGLVAKTALGEEVARLDDRCAIDSDAIWVLRDQGPYITNYYGDETVYRDE